MQYLSAEWRAKLLFAGFPEEKLEYGIAEEIIPLLPDSVELEGDTAWPLVNFAGVPRRYRIPYMVPEKQVAGIHPPLEKTLADAAASIYCYLKEHKFF